MGFFDGLRRLLARDLTGRTWTREADHDFFGRIVYFGFKDAEGYWEAELDPPWQEKRFSATMPGTPEGPTPGEVVFCKDVLADPDALFERCRAAFAETYGEWTELTMPEAWRDGFDLDGIEVPADGDPSLPWSACYFVAAANHWFTAEFEDGAVRNVVVDG